MSIMIYGAGTYGTLTKKILDHKGEKVSCFIDRKYAGTKVEGLDVIAPEEIFYGCEDTIYIAAKNYFREIKEILLEKGCKDIRDIRKVIDIQLESLPSTLSEYERDLWAHRRTYELAVDMCDMKGITLNHVEVVLTQRCTLRCKECSSLMPYYTNPKDIPVEELIYWLNNLLDAVTFIGEVRILGGEPFLNRSMGQLIESFSEHRKIGMISIYSNGMVVPKENLLRELVKNGIPVHISDYGVGGKQRMKAVAVFRGAGVNVYLRKYDSWYMMGEVKNNGKSEDELKKMFMNCKSAACLTILNGKLYQCPRAAHAEAIGAVICAEDERADLVGNVDEKTLVRLSEKEEYITTCRYCLGTNAGSIEAARQV